MAAVAAGESPAASSRFVLYVDEDEKKRQAQKRRKQRQRQGYAAKRRKVAKIPNELPLEDCWELYLRLILVATFRKIAAEWEKSDREEALNAILCCCPPDRGVEYQKLFDSKLINSLVDGDFGAIFDLTRRVRDDEKIEPALLSKAATMLHKLKDYFPENSKSLEGTPYAGHTKNFGGKVLENLTNEMKLAARVGHLGAKFESSSSSS